MAALNGLIHASDTGAVIKPWRHCDIAEGDDQAFFC
jgi:hypothetical protein